jgi:hypothetical protein
MTMRHRWTALREDELAYALLVGALFGVHHLWLHPPDGGLSGVG